MKRVFFLSTLQMLSCCEHISNYQILIKGDFDNDIRSLLTSNYEAMLYHCLQEAANSQLCACVKL